MMRKIAFVLLVLVNSVELVRSQPAPIADVQPLGKSGLFKSITFKGKKYFVCEVDPRQYKIELFNQLPGNKGVYSFEAIAAEKKSYLVFAMNGGMFQPDFSPVGLFIGKGTSHAINVEEGTGNFYALKPNGVFLIDIQDVAHVLTSEGFVSTKYKAKIATQSGPMLVIDGAFNSNFKENSANLNIRNGVGVTKNNRTVFVISTEPVNFYEFAQLFRDGLGCDNALYLDGAVSQYFAPELQASPLPGAPLGVFIVVSRK